MNLERRFALVEGMKFRHEAFGGIVYQRQKDKLIFLKSRLAIDILGLLGRGTVQEIIPLISCKETFQDKERQVLHVLSSLKEMGIIHELAE